MSKIITIKVICFIAALIAVSYMVSTIKVYTQVKYTCLKCRTEKLQHRIFGFSWQSLYETEFTSWYYAQYSKHEHVWEQISCTLGRSIFGNSTSVSCKPSIHPIYFLTPRVQREFAEKADVGMLSKFFDGVLSTNRDEQIAAVNSVLSKKK